MTTGHRPLGDPCSRDFSSARSPFGEERKIQVLSDDGTEQVWEGLQDPEVEQEKKSFRSVWVTP